MGALPIRALSVRQPWAWAIIHAGKDVENRSKYAITMGGMKPGRIAIHASKGMTRAEYEAAARFMESIHIACPRPDQLVRGAIIGTVEVSGHVSSSASPWFFGPWALTLTAAAPCDPVPAAGKLGYFDWKEDPGARADALPWMTAWPNLGRRLAEATAENGLLL